MVWQVIVAIIVFGCREANLAEGAPKTGRNNKSSAGFLTRGDGELPRDLLLPPNLT